jgi:hypothetical protein
MRLWSFPVILLLAVGASARVAPGLIGDSNDNRPAPKVPCNQTVGAGTNLSGVIADARPGTTICLRSGTYGPIDLTAVRKAPAVTVRSAPGARPKVDGIYLIDPVGLRFVALHLIEGVSVSPSASNIAFIKNDIRGHRGIYIFGDYRIGKRVKNVRIQGNQIHDIDYNGRQETAYGYGIEGVGDVRHVVVAGNTIRRTASDYIQSASPVDWLVDGNTFLGPSLLGSHEDHQDLWQIFGGGRNITFTDNVARNTGTQESLLFQEGAFENVNLTNNLFVNDSRGYTCQIFQSSGLVFRRNTIVGSRWGCLFRDLASAPPGSGYQVERNIFVETREGPGISTEGRAGGWGTYAYNVSDDGSASGPGSVGHWHPRWWNKASYRPRGLSVAAGYHGPGR